MLGEAKNYHRHAITVDEWKASPQGSHIAPDNVPYAIEVGYEMAKSQLSYSPMKPLFNRVVGDVETLLKEGVPTSDKFKSAGTGINSAVFVPLDDEVVGVWKAHNIEKIWFKL